MNFPEQRILPPDGLSARFAHYSTRYGYLHAVCSFLGRKSFFLWKLLGPVVTKGYLKKWLASTEFKIVNLGGGSLLYERWLTADVDPRSDAYVDIKKNLPFQTDSIDVVYLEEVIEHISNPEGIALMQECYRVIKPGGWIRITTPSLNFFAQEFFSNPKETRNINEIFRLHGHEHIYSEDELMGLLSTIGFTKVIPSKYRDKASRFGSFDTHPERFSFAPPEWSQYWEAEK